MPERSKKGEGNLLDEKEVTRERLDDIHQTAENTTRMDSLKDPRILSTAVDA